MLDMLIAHARCLRNEHARCLRNEHALNHVACGVGFAVVAAMADDEGDSSEESEVDWSLWQYLKMVKRILTRCQKWPRQNLAVMVLSHFVFVYVNRTVLGTIGSIEG